MSLWQNLKKSTTFSMPVFIPSFIFMALVVVLSLAIPGKTEAFLQVVKQWGFDYFSWFYTLVVSIFIAFLFLLSLSSFGNLKLGNEGERPEFSFWAWLSMLFAAGMGVGLMYFGVAEPLLHSTSPITKAAAHPTQEAMLYTFLHWGIHAWAIYGMIALALAYFGYRYKLPLALRSVFYPLLKDKIYGPIGHVIDITALVVTVFGIITTLGYGAIQINAGLNQIGLLSNVGIVEQASILGVVIFLAVLSAISGVGKGVRILSEINFFLVILFLIFILAVGPSVYLMSAFSDNIGYYLSNLVRLSFKTYSYEPDHESWFQGWTILYWAWWLSWAPFVGLFIARISRGRTIREFIFGVLIIPALFCLLWFTILGNSALWINAHSDVLIDFISTPERLLFVFLDQFPFSLFTSIMAMIILTLFFITSADSGILVLNNFASNGRSHNIPRWQNILWGIVIISLAVSLLKSGGLPSIQALTLVVALPFAVVALFMCYSLLIALQIDSSYYDTKFNQSHVYWNGDHWQSRLKQILKQTQKRDVLAYIRKIAKPAFESIKQEMEQKYNMQVTISEISEPPSIQLNIEKGEFKNFIYGITMRVRDTSEEMVKSKNIPLTNRPQVFIPMTYFGDGRSGYDVQYMNQNELIADILKHYQRYIELLGNKRNDILVADTEDHDDDDDEIDTSMF